jgi:hypothetical protein
MIFAFTLTPEQMRECVELSDQSHALALKLDEAIDRFNANEPVPGMVVMAAFAHLIAQQCERQGEADEAVALIVNFLDQIFLAREEDTPKLG